MPMATKVIAIAETNQPTSMYQIYSRQVIQIHHSV